MTELVTSVDGGRGILGTGLLPDVDVDMGMDALGSSRRDLPRPEKDEDVMEGSSSQSPAESHSNFTDEGCKGDVDALLDMLCDQDDSDNQGNAAEKPVEKLSKTEITKGTADAPTDPSVRGCHSKRQHDSEVEARLKRPLEEATNLQNEVVPATVGSVSTSTSEDGVDSRSGNGNARLPVQPTCKLSPSQEPKRDPLMLMRSLYQEGRERRLSRKRAVEAAAAEASRSDVKKHKNSSEEHTSSSASSSFAAGFAQGCEPNDGMMSQEVSSSFSSSSALLSPSSCSPSSSSMVAVGGALGREEVGSSKVQRLLESPSMQYVKRQCSPPLATSQDPMSACSEATKSGGIDDCVVLGSASKKRRTTTHLIEDCGDIEGKKAADEVDSSKAKTSTVVIVDDGDQKEEKKPQTPSRSADELLAASLESAESRAGATPPPMGSDADLAAYLQQKEDSEWSAKQQLREQQDAVLASMLQAEENAVMDPQQEAEQMKSTTQGRAWLLAKEVIAFCKESAEFSSKADQVEAVAIDEMVETAARFIACRDQFEKEGRPAQATIAYHYTKTHNIESIKENGLMTGEDQRKNNLGVRGGCGVYGEGLYFGGNPFAFSSYGQIGLVVAVLKGRQQRVWGRHDAAEVTKDGAVNTVIGNKRLRGGFKRHPRAPSVDDGTNVIKQDFPSEPSKEIAHHDEFVLQQTCQCFPMVRFNQTMVSQNDDSNAGNRLVWTIHQELQKILDNMVNGGKTTPLERVFPSVVRARGNFRARIPPLLPPPQPSNQPLPFLAPMVPPVGATGLHGQPFPLPSAFPPLGWAGGMATNMSGTIPTPATVFGVPFHPVPLSRQTPGQVAASSSSSSSQPTAGDTTTTLHSIPLSPPQTPQTAAWAPQPFASGLGSSSSSSALLTASSQATTQSFSPQATTFSSSSTSPTRLTMLAQASGLLLSPQPTIGPPTNVANAATSVSLSAQGTNLETTSHSSSLPTTSQASLPVRVPSPSNNVSSGQQPAPAPISSYSSALPSLPGSADLLASSPSSMTVPLSSQLASLPTSSPASIAATLPTNHASQTTTPATANQQPQGQLDCTKPAAQVSASVATKAAMESQDFVLFLRVLMQLLEQRDPALHTRATAVLEECKEKHKAGDPSYRSLADSLENGLRQLVGQVHWQEAEANFNSLKALEQQRLQRMQMQLDLKRIQLQRQRRELQMQILHQRVPPPPLPQQQQHGLLGQPAGGSNTSTQGMMAISSSQSSKDDSYREEITYTAPDTLPDKGDALETTAIAQCKTNECSICMDTFRATKEVVRLRECGHEFHRECMEASLKRQSTCPMCRRSIRGEPQGTSPSGTMTVTRSTIRCSGFESSHSLVIEYSLPAGVQKRYHDNPGLPYGSTKRNAYLPDNSDGQKLLKRLKYAWSKGLTFTIGTSLTTGRPNSIVWSSIQHKSGYSGGSHSFPDPTFFSDVNQELDTLCVPKADQCP